MAKEELKKVNRQQQRLVNQSPAQLKRSRQQQNSQTVGENLDTVEQGGKKWSLTGIVMAGVLIATAAGVGSQFKLLTKGKSAPPSTPNAAVNNATPQAGVNQRQEQQGQVLLGQAKLLAAQGQPQQLSQAIAILQRVPAGVAVTPEAQNLSATWAQQIMEQATAEVQAGKIPEAIALAELIPANSPQYQQAQQQAQQWQQQLAAAQEQEFAATLAEAARPTPLPPPVALPAPVTAPEPVTTAAAVPSPAVTPEVQASPSVAPQTQPAAATVQQPPSNNQPAQFSANDPYLNVAIPQLNQPQVQGNATTNSTVALGNFANLNGNSFGFRNMATKASTVAIRLRDNVDEDGDFVSLIVNGEVITENEMIFNRGQVLMVDLLPGENKIEIYGDKDGEGGITLEVNVAGVGNINETPIPEGSTASFIINREQ
ncbi:MAG: hypothetical protein AAFQ80_00980 [Cyanobacteria bacterium J06621_8]